MGLGGLKNCNVCGKVFSGIQDTCPDCIKEEEKKFEIVYKYLRDNPKLKTAELAQATEVDEELIVKFIKQGKIKTTDSDNILNKKGNCQKCGKEIVLGQYCSDCLGELSKASQTLGDRANSIKDSVHSSY